MAPLNFDPENRPRLLSCRRLWDRGEHNGLTDLIRFQDRWFCAFRQAQHHVGGQNGITVVLESADGEEWEQAAALAEPGIDLRDPKLSVTSSGQLMLLMGGSRFDARGTFLDRQSRVAFSDTGRDWTGPFPILSQGEWLWRLTWKGMEAYGLSYNPDRRQGQEKDWILTLFHTTDGLDYTPIRRLDAPGLPNEATLRFLPDDTMLALIRREAPPCHGWIGRSLAPYRQWQYTEIPHRLGGPNFLQDDEGRIWAAGRGFVEEGGELRPKTVVACMSPTEYQPLLVLPSGGDTGYPGMVIHEGTLWISYYSSHEGKANIYLARIRLPE